MAQQVNLVAGPSKFDLSVALFDRRTGHRHPIEIKDSDGAVYEVVVEAVQAEDGSGDSWNINGYAKPKVTSSIPGIPVRQMNIRGRKCTIYFRTDFRKGWFRFDE